MKIASNILSIGGSARLEKYKSNCERLIKQYNKYFEEYKPLNDSINELYTNIKTYADDIDYILKKFDLENIVIDSNKEKILKDPETFLTNKNIDNFSNTEIITVATSSVALPTATAVLAHTFGTAATGTAISSLPAVLQPGVIMSLLGGGSVASGGLGIAAGQFVLPALGLAPLAYIPLKKHKTANGYKKKCKLLEKILGNRLTLDEINRNTAKIKENIEILNIKKVEFINKISQDCNDFAAEITSIITEKTS